MGAGSVVAVAGAGDELPAAARGNDFHLNDAEGAVAARVGRIISKGVLIPDVVSDLLADIVDVIDVLAWAISSKALLAFLALFLLS